MLLFWQNYVTVYQNVETNYVVGDFFQYILVLVDRNTWYLLLVGRGRYPMNLVEALAGPDTLVINFFYH